MMRAQLSAATVEYRIAKLPAQRCFHDIDRRGNGQGSILPFQEIDE
jgi:hypothetical protein